VHALVTGSAGFVGRHLLPRLGAEGFEVVGTDLELDVADTSAVASKVAELRPDAIVHLAAVSSVAASWREPELAYRVNYLGTRSVLEAAARGAPEARVLLVGSAEEYGSAEPGSIPFTEAAPLCPRSPYARTKAAADLLGAGYAERGLDVVRARPFNHAGPGQPDAFVLASFARQVAEIESGRREPVLRVGNLDSMRDFLDIDDVIEAYVRLLDRGVPAGVYNVASGTGRPLGEHLQALLALAGLDPAIEVDPERLRPADFSVGNAGRLREATGWVPRVPLSRTLERVLGYWREQVRAS
jgi:GDP-4-dehydro-6-deoxy-D-mannose reductase